MKSIVKIGLVGAGHFLNAILGFTFLAMLGRALSLEDFGKFALLSALLVGLAKLTDFGTNNLFVAKSITENNDNLYNTFISTKVVLFLIGLPISYLVMYFLGLLTVEIGVIYFVGYIAYTLSFTFYTIFQKLEKFSHLVILNSIPAVIKAVFAILMYLSLWQPTVENGFGVFALVIVPSLLLYFFIPHEFRAFKINFGIVKTFLKQTFPAGVSQITGEGWQALSNSVAKISSGFSDTGIYGLADKMSTIYQLVSFSIITVLLPQNAKRKKDHMSYNFKETILLSGLIMMAGFVAAILSKYFILFFFGQKFSASIGLVYILIFAYAITAIHTFLENYFYVEQKTNALMKVSLARLAVFLVSASFLVTNYGLTGLAWAQIVASTAALLVTVKLILG